MAYIEFFASALDRGSELLAAARAIEFRLWPPLERVIESCIEKSDLFPILGRQELRIRIVATEPEKP